MIGSQAGYNLDTHAIGSIICAHDDEAYKGGQDLPYVTAWFVPCLQRSNGRGRARKHRLEIILTFLALDVQLY